MAKIIGIGETILDIIFKENQPTKSVPGGSTFNSMITLGRLGVTALFITEIGNDRVGKIILDFMCENNLTTKHVDLFDTTNAMTPVSLAFLDEKNDAQYAFYHRFPDKRLDFLWPTVEPGDLVIFGSYFAVDPILHSQITEFLSYAKEQKAIIYYDVNFRESHAHEAMRIMPIFLENLELADIVRGSKDDFSVLLNETDPQKIYRNHISFYTPNFIYTDGGNGIDIFCNAGHNHIETYPIQTVSTIGAGDNFNAGILFGLLQNNISLNIIDNLSLTQWDHIIKYGIDLASEVCTSYDNYISKEYADKYTSQR